MAEVETDEEDEGEKIPKEDFKIKWKTKNQSRKGANGENGHVWKRLAALLDGILFSIFLVVEIVLAWKYMF